MYDLLHFVCAGLRLRQGLRTELRLPFGLRSVVLHVVCAGL
jgi:hypothetical protein